MFRTPERKKTMSEKEIKPAAEILNDMVEQAADILTRKLPETVIVK